jgi:hypothetical protein
MKRLRDAERAFECSATTEVPQFDYLNCGVDSSSQSSGKTKDVYDSAVHTYICCLASWASASLMPLTRASSVT